MLAVPQLDGALVVSDSQNVSLLDPGQRTRVVTVLVLAQLFNVAAGRIPQVDHFAQRHRHNVVVAPVHQVQICTE